MTQSGILNKKSLLIPLLVMAFVVGMFVNTYAVGELLGLNIRVVMDDGQSFEGMVVEESDDTITLEEGNQEITVRRDEIKTMRLLQSSTVVQTNTSSSSAGISDPVFSDVRRSAMQRVAFWQLFRDGIQLGSSLFSLTYAQNRAQMDLTIPLIWYGGLGVGGFVVDLLFKPSIEERLFWRSQLPFWHGFNGLAGGIASLGGGISLAMGVTTEAFPDPNLGTADEWFERAILGFMIESGSHAINMLYDLITLLAPPS